MHRVITHLSLTLLLACACQVAGPGAADGADGGAGDVGADAGPGGDGDGDGDGDGPCEPLAMELQGETPLPAEIAAILERRCWHCHGDPVDNYAPMSLTTWEAVQAPRHMANPDPNYVVIGERIHSESFPMPPAMQPQLTADEIATLDAWIADCAPAGE